jgi:hypothetical protein
MLFNVVNEKGPCGLQFCALQASTAAGLVRSGEPSPSYLFNVQFRTNGFPPFLRRC